MIATFAHADAKDAPSPAGDFARFIIADEGQAILTKHGFGPGNAAK